MTAAFCTRRAQVSLLEGASLHAARIELRVQGTDGTGELSGHRARRVSTVRGAFCAQVSFSEGASLSAARVHGAGVAGEPGVTGCRRWLTPSSRASPQGALPRRGVLEPDVGFLWVVRDGVLFGLRAYGGSGRWEST